MRRTTGLWLGIACLWACERGGSSGGEDATAKPEPKPAATAPSTGAAPVTATAAEAAPADAPAAAQPPAVPAAAVPTALPPGRSTVPTVEQWDKVGEVTVKGSSALNCETKMVREWLRVSCRGKNDTGGTPTTVQITRGGRPGDVFTFASGGVVSLVTAFVDGVHLEAVFSWTDKSHKLVVQWPHGAPKPPILGVFEGAASPLDGVAGSDVGAPKRLCECMKKLGQTESDCSDLSDFYANADCYRSYASDCQAFTECSRGEPNRPPSCLAGFRNGPINSCYKVCADGVCPSGSTCSADWGEPKVCVPD